MKAAKFHGTQDVRIEDVEADSVGPADVRVEVAVCGICGTDIHEYDSGPIFIPDAPHPVTGKTVPITMGHEFSGVVSEVGSEVTRLTAGDAVAIEPNIPCHHCRYCEEGKFNLCLNLASIGLHTDTGGFAEQAVVPAQQAHRLPDGVTLEEGALVEPLAVGVHATRRSGLSLGDTVAVFGAGPIGLSVVRAVNAAGAKRIFVSEPQPARRERAAELGADYTIDPLETDAVEVIQTETDGGVDVAIEFAAIEASFNDAVRSTKHDGTVTVGSISEEEITTDLNDIVTTERTVKGSFCYGFPPRSFRTEFDTIIQSLADGTIDVEPFVTGRIALDDIVESGFEAILDPESEHVKILVST